MFSDNSSKPLLTQFEARIKICQPSRTYEREVCISESHALKISIPVSEQNCLPSTPTFVEFLIRALPNYYTTPEQRRKAREEDAKTNSLYHGARLVREATKLLPLKNSKQMQGELGELITSLIATHYLDLHYPIAKVRLKTSRNMPIYSADGIYVSRHEDGHLILWVAESKMYKDVKPAINAALPSLENSTKNIHGELLLLRDNVDLDSAELTDFVLQYFNDDTEEYNSLHIHHLVNVTYSDPKSYEHEDLKYLQENFEELDGYFHKKFEDNELGWQNVKVVFFRLPDVQRLTEDFSDSI